MTYTIVILARAREDVQRIHDWIAEPLIGGAGSVVRELREGGRPPAD